MRRIKIQIPSLWANAETNWAPACGASSPPEPGEVVWVAFEMGDENYPVWLGTADPTKGGEQTKSKTYTLPAHPGSRTAAAFVEEALAQVGKPYVLGGDGPNVFDCSGLVQYCLARVGISAPRTSEEQYAWATPITEQELELGDLIFEQWPGDDSPPGHVIIYYENSLVIEAPQPGQNVHVRSWSPAETEIVGYGSVPGLTY